MAKSYFAEAADGTVVDNVATPPASGVTRVLVDMGPTRGLEWRYSGDVDGVNTFYVVNNGPTLGKQKSAT
jgi:hypothetical protein